MSQPVTVGGGQQLFRTPVCDPGDNELNWQAAQQLHDMLGNPMPSNDPDAPVSGVGTVLVPFRIQSAFDGSMISADAIVLETDGSTTSARLDLFDPLGLWASVDHTDEDESVGSLIKHPTSGEQVILIISGLGDGGGGGGGVDTYKVKVSVADASDYLQDQFDNAGGYAGDPLDAETKQAVEFVSDGEMMYARVPLIKVNADDSTASYLEDAFTNADKSSSLNGLSGGPWQQVFFNTSSDNDTMWAYTSSAYSEYGGGGGETSGGCGVIVDEGVISIDIETLPGPGLGPYGSCQIAVNAGCGITFGEDAELMVDISEIIADSEGIEAYGAGCGFKVTPYTGGCGITVDGHEISVDNTDLVDEDGGLIASGSCGLAVDTGCGIYIDDDGAVAVNPGDFTASDYGLSICDYPIDLRTAIYNYIVEYPDVIIEAIKDKFIPQRVVEKCDGMEIVGGKLKLNLVYKDILTIDTATDVTETPPACEIDVATECP